jgi:hypothetical protein
MPRLQEPPPHQQLARPEEGLDLEALAAAGRLAVPLISERRLKGGQCLELRPAAALRLQPPTAAAATGGGREEPAAAAAGTEGVLLAAAQAEAAEAQVQSEALQVKRERLRAEVAAAGAKQLGRSAELAARLAQDQREAQERIAASLRVLLAGQQGQHQQGLQGQQA